MADVPITRHEDHAMTATAPPRPHPRRHHGAIGSAPTRWWRLRMRRLRDRRVHSGPVLGLDGFAERGLDIGVAFDGRGWFAAAACPDAVGLEEALAVAEPMLDGRINAVQLLTQVSGPGSRATWLAVRRDVPGSFPVAADRGGGVTGVNRALCGALGRVVKTAGRQGIPLRPLSRDDLNDATHLTLAAGGSATERWRRWRGTDRDQVSYGLRGDLAHLAPLWAELSDVDAEACVMSVALNVVPRRGPVVRCLARVADPSFHVDAACANLTTLARRHGLRPKRCDGVHGPAAYASSLTGGAW
ncbi:MAG TPA: type VII secretion protein EccE [Stackebrandtia sp.]|jgi:hypothetical protein|uniref:type VII secretion protein EccE n=1 Tax=Stackebrandtia sp. TaxID=2023065 RepID=UPI002D67FAFD|nr:type VII secretion protein EccE [Stackebrandtia sp.]HZE39122.1 type VII secretion protein EccE [Stackebrandtia sp.]